MFPRVVTSERGATLVEFAIVGPLFLLLLIISIDLLRITYSTLTVQFVATRVFRDAVVGPGNRPATYSSQAEWIETETINWASGLGVTLQPENIGICPYRSLSPGSFCDPLNDNGGLPGELVVVQINVPLQGVVWGANSMLSWGVYTIEAQVVGRNERWS